MHYRLFGSTQNHRLFRRLITLVLAFVCMGWCFALSAHAEPGLRFSSDTTNPWILKLAPAPSRDTIPYFETQVLLADLKTSRSAKKASSAISPTAQPGGLGLATAEDSLDLETYRAFRQREDVIGVWNDSVRTMLSRTDRQKQGNLKIGVALPSAVESIVGEGGAGLKVSGYQRIAFGGTSQWTDAASTATVKQNKFPSLKMDQVNRFTVEGTVGSKINVSVDQDSRRTTDLENRIIVRYKSDEDDIIQSIDLGNTNLALTDSRFIGYSEQIQGLFGIGVTGKLGPVNWKMIASQEKGNTTRARLTAGANEQTIIIRDTKFDATRFYDIGWFSGQAHLAPGDVITQFRLFEGQGKSTQEAANLPFGYAYFDVLNSAATQDSIDQAWKELDAVNEYTISNENHYIFFPARRTNALAPLAYWLVVQRSSGSVDTIGQASPGSDYRLQLLKQSLPKIDDGLWDAAWRNVYDLTIRNIDYQSFDLDIFKGTLNDEANPANLNHPEGSGTPYLQLMGLDAVDAVGNPTPDGKVDNSTAILYLDLGLLVFPNRRPFASPVLGTDSMPDIYREATQTTLNEKTKFYMKLTTRSRSKSMRLNAVNILEGSEVITLNGQKLTRGAQYTIDYSLGEVNFIDDNVLDPNSTVTIDYEYAPFVNSEKRSLFGLSTKIEPSQSFRTGATVLYKGTKATDRPAQLGAEPYRDLVGEYFLNLSTGLPFLTRAINSLPLLKTTAPSSISFQGAVAGSMPNPNTRGSVFVDDFEGARRLQSLSVVRESWSIASPPLDPENPTDTLPRRDHNVADTSTMTGLYDPAFIWFNPINQFEDTAIYKRDVNRNGTDRRMHVLVGEFRPGASRTKDPADDSGTTAWGGIMRGLSKGLWDQSRAEAIEIRMAVVKRPGAKAGKLHIDLGRITEDVNGNRRLDTEDSARGVTQTRNNLLEDDEDNGLDHVPDSLEIGPDGIGYDPVTNPDPAGDNWDYDSKGSPNFYDHINGTERSIRDPVRGLKPDTEDLGGESEFDQTNEYFEYTLDLDATSHLEEPALVDSTEKTTPNDVTGYSSSGLTWRTYRIPLSDSLRARMFGEPSLQSIEYARLWINGANATMRVYIAAIDITEPTWKAAMVSDVEGANPTPTIEVGVKNTEENVDYRNASPPGVSGYHNVTNDFTEKEQSLTLSYNNFRDADSGRVKILIPKEDYTGYRSLEMWVHTDQTASDGNSVFYLRFGSDSLNYYEYHSRLTYSADPDSNWRANAVRIDFDQLTALKDTTVRGPAGHDSLRFDPVYKNGVFGAPSLATINYREIGVYRLRDTTGTVVGPVTGEIWCDELRLTDVRKDPGMAGSGRVTLQLADFIGLSAGVDNQTYAFQSLNQGRTAGQSGGRDAVRTSANGTIYLDRLVPPSVGLSLPVSINYSKDVSTPRLLTGSDIVLTKERQSQQRSTSIGQGISVPITLKPKNAGWLFRATLGSLTARFSGSRSQSWTPTVPESRSTTYTAAGNYSLKFSERLSFQPLVWTRYVLFPKRLWATKFSLLPSDFRASGTLQRDKNYSRNSSGLITEGYTRTFNGCAGTSLSPIPAITIQYNMTTQRDLSDSREVNLSMNPRQFRLGTELGFTQSVSGSYRPDIVSFLAPSLNYSASFNDRVDRIAHDHDVTGSRNWSVTGQFDPNKFWSFMGARPKSATKKAVTKAGGRTTDKQTEKEAGGKGSKPDDKDEKAKSGEDKREAEGPPADTAAGADRGGARKSKKAGTALKPGDKIEGKEGADTTAAGREAQAQAPTTGSGGGGAAGAPIDAWRSMMGAFRWITSPFGGTTLNYARANTDASQNLITRPSQLYQLGLDLNPDVAVAPTAGGNLTLVNTQTERETYGASNQINLFNFLSLANKYTFNRTTTYKAGSKVWSEGEIFPSLSTSLSRLERWPVLSWIFANASLRTSYEKKVDRTYQLPDGLQTRTKGRTFGPAVQGTTRNGITTTFGYDLGSTETESFKSSTRTKRNSSGFRLTTNYSFSSPYGIPIPLLRGIRLRSQLALGVNISIKSDRTYTAKNTRDSNNVVLIGDYELTQSSKVLTITPQATYSFSLRVKGGMSAEWTDRSDNSPQVGNRKSHVRSLGFWAEFSF